MFIGRSIETKLVRNGKVIGKLFDNPSYDFNYQFVMDIKPTKLFKVRSSTLKNLKTVDILYLHFLFKGDALVTTCGYNTMDRSKFTYVCLKVNFSNFFKYRKIYIFHK